MHFTVLPPKDARPWWNFDEAIWTQEAEILL
jgi:hypothetical protein